LEINQGYTMLHGQPIIKIRIYIKICNNCSYMFRFWLNHHQGACSLRSLSYYIGIS